MIKYFLQVEIARHCLVHNRTTFQAINECPGPKFRGTSWIGLVYMAGYFVTTLPIIGIIGALGGLMHELWPLPMTPEHSVQVWGALNVLLALALLVGRRVRPSRNAGDDPGRRVQHLGRRRRAS